MGCANPTHDWVVLFSWIISQFLSLGCLASLLSVLRKAGPPRNNLKWSSNQLPKEWVAMRISGPEGNTSKLYSNIGQAVEHLHCWTTQPSPHCSHMELPTPQWIFLAHTQHFSHLVFFCQSPFRVVWTCVHLQTEAYKFLYRCRTGRIPP